MGGAGSRGADVPGWLDASALRVGLGCMRLSTDDDIEAVQAFETIAAAAAGGITVFDTAHAYARDAADLGHNERLLAAALRQCGAASHARIVTKGGMSRAGGGWHPDGRAKSVAADCEASLAALDGLPIDLYLIHAPDPRVPWPTTVRALARLADSGAVRRIGVCNVNRAQLDQALDLAPITAVQVSLSLYDDRAVRGGIVERCEERGLTLIAHSPLGGPRRAVSLQRHEALRAVADARRVTQAEVALAWLLALSPSIVAIPGARRAETARSAAHAATIDLDAGEQRRLTLAFVGVEPVRRQPPPPAANDSADVVLVMGIPGAGKSRVAGDYGARGYDRLNRDELGGSLKQLAAALDERLRAGARRVVLDNTYLTRASRSYVVETAARHGARVRCVWIDVSLDQAQVNLVERLLQRFGSLPGPDELRTAARREPGLLTPTSQMRTMRELEPPSAEEGWADIEHVDFTREPPAPATSGGVFVAAAVFAKPGWHRAVACGGPTAPHLVFDWRPDATTEGLDPLVATLAAAVSGPVEAALCPHPGGPPSCWCRPPLPGLPLAFAHAHRLDAQRSTLIGTTPTHRRLAGALGARYLDADG